MKKIKLLIYAVVIGLLFSACSSKKDDATDDKPTNTNDQILSIGLTNPFHLFNPLNTPDVQGRWAQRFLYEPLVEMIEPLTFAPRLAESFETTDNQTYHIKLNQAAKWTDGQPITADDVIFTFELFVNPGSETNRAPAFSLIEGVESNGKLPEGTTDWSGIEKINDFELSFRTSKPTDENLVKEFIGYAIYILPKHVWKNTKPEDIPTADFATTPTVTSGPYTFTNFEQDSYLELDSNPDFYLGEPLIKKIFLRMMNAQNLATELTTAGLTLNASGGIGVVPVQDIDTLTNHESLTVRFSPSINPQVMVYNMEKLADENIRLAIAHAINRQAMVDQLLLGHGEILNSPFGEQHPYRDPNLEPITYDPEKARELIAESDFDVSQEIELIVPLGNLVREQSANLIAADLENVGLKTKQSTYDFPTLLDRGRSGNYHLMLVGYGLTVDPDVTSYLSENGASHYSRYQSAENERLLIAGRAAVQQSDKEAIYFNLQNLWKKDLPILPLYNPDYIIVQKNSFQGGIHDFWQGSLADVHLWSFGD